MNIDSRFSDQIFNLICLKQLKILFNKDALKLRYDTLFGIFLVGEEMDTSTSQTSLTESSVSADHLNSIAELVKDKWELLASKFADLDPDDLQYFKEKETPLLQATNMLTVWKVWMLYNWNHSL